MKPKPLDGIPIPPFTHSILGHPDMMLSPLKHILRWEVAERARAAFHQLVMMKHASIFINSAELAKKLFEKLPTKGPIYEIFRYNKMIPDLFSSDGEPWELRSKHLREALTNVKLVPADLETILAQLDTCLKEYSETGKSLAIDQLLMKLCLDIVSMAVFGYKLNALSDSVDGQKIVQCLNTLTEHTSGQGIYANPKARKYSQEDLKLVGSDWRMYLTKMLRSCQAECKEYKSKHGELDVKNKFSHALIHLSEIDASYGEPELLAEIHQVIRHGHEYIQGTLWWGFYVLFKKPEVSSFIIIDYH